MLAIQTSSLSLNSRCLGRSVFLHPAALPGMQCQPPVPCDDGAFVTGIASVFSSVKLIDLAVVFDLLQTVLQTLPKALSPSGFSSSWGAILLPICSWYRSHSLPWMSAVFSCVFSKPPFETRGPELQAALRTPWIYSNMVWPCCFLSFPRNQEAGFSQSAEH